MTREAGAPATYSTTRAIAVATQGGQRNRAAPRFLIGIALSIIAWLIFAPLGWIGVIVTLFATAAAARPSRPGVRTIKAGWFGPCPTCGAETVLPRGKDAPDQRFACHACNEGVLFRDRRFLPVPTPRS